MVIILFHYIVDAKIIELFKAIGGVVFFMSAALVLFYDLCVLVSSVDLKCIFFGDFAKLLLYLKVVNLYREVI